MSCVECYVRLKSSNKWELAYEVGNAWQGCMHLFLEILIIRGDS